ncbi:MAG TPA: anthranilate synthase component I [Verrucomicrobiales bacterium]|jgi:anthranilate synthase component 1|nr:anthranilate synthase component I [Verrucomicrobiales bacterium]
MSTVPLQPSFEEFQTLAAQGNLIPVWAELTADYETPLSAFEKIADGAPRFLFESAETTGFSGRYSFMGAHPRAIITARGREVEIKYASGAADTFTTGGDPLADLEHVMAKFRPVPQPRLPVFNGGAVGFLTYDMVRFFEPTVPAAPKDELGLPEMVFLIADSVVIFDHRYRLMQVVVNACLTDFPDARAAYDDARRRIDEIIARLNRPLHVKPMAAVPAATPETAVSNTTRAEYLGMVEKAKEYIRAGDIFQVVPSQRFEVPYTGRPIELFRALRHVNPSPYMFCLEFGDFALVGSSPEVHVRCMNGRVDIRPIAGTRWRGKTAAEDDALAAELLADEKERAEHIMLVDLARNDVGRVSTYATVQVSDLMTIERYSHVMHIVTNVHGRLAPDKSAYDVMRATFPAGTVSGSPKVRAMQIINELEKSKRCAYAGAVGYFGFDGNLDSCIALRTVVLRHGKAYVQAGAGIVADSVPESEYTETVNKAAAALRAVERASRL